MRVPDWLKSKVFWCAAITVVLEILNAIISKGLWPQYTEIIGLVIVGLGGILTAIGGTVNSVRLTKAKAKINK